MGTPERISDWCQHLEDSGYLKRNEINTFQIVAPHVNCKRLATWKTFGSRTFYEFDIFAVEFWRHRELNAGTSGPETSALTAFARWCRHLSSPLEFRHESVGKGNFLSIHAPRGNFERKARQTHEHKDFRPSKFCEHDYCRWVLSRKLSHFWQK